MKYYKWFGDCTKGMNPDIAGYIRRGPVLIEIPDNEECGRTENYGWREITNAELLIEINHKTPILKRMLHGIFAGPYRSRWRQIKL